MDKRFGVMINCWNAQGGSRDKIQYLAPMISAAYGNILVLQEEGVPGNTGYEEGETVIIDRTEFICLEAKIDMTAVNLRCSTAILVEKELWPHIVAVNQYAPAVQRPLCYVDLAAGVRIATVHATAYAPTAIPEVKGYIEWLDENSPPNGWILAGDFNSQPEDYPLHIFGNSTIALSANVSQEIPYKAYSAGGILFCNVLFDANPTQGAGGGRVNKYDFTFYRSEPGFVVSRIANRMVLDCRDRSCMDFMCPTCTRGGIYISDHNLIQTLVFM